MKTWAVNSRRTLWIKLHHWKCFFNNIFVLTLRISCYVFYVFWHFSPSSLISLFNTPLSETCAASVFVAVGPSTAVSWSTRRYHPLKKTDSPLGSNHHLPIVPLPAGGASGPLSSMFECSLTSSCAGNHNFCGFMSAVPLSCSENTILP